MTMNRRNFMFLGAAFASSCAGSRGVNFASKKPEQTIHIGPSSLYLADGVYSQYRATGFFIVRRGATLMAISSICTHRNCKLDVEKDKTFYCSCHGSEFDVNGHVTEGPARRDLPQYAISPDGKGGLLVRVSAT
jgi:Rieske Fe-S protein